MKLKKDIFNKTFIRKDESSNLVEFKLLEGWCQGIFQNLSSLVHVSEQILRSKLMIEGPVMRAVHSDDKNEVYSFKKIKFSIETISKIIKLNKFHPKLFSLTTSETKDSYSFLLSEMVGVINEKGKLFNNPVKTIGNIFYKLDYCNYPNTYLSLITRISNYYQYSGSEISSYIMEDLTFTYLNRYHNNKSVIETLPLSIGGRFKADWNLYCNFGDITDQYSKLILDPYLSYILSNISIIQYNKKDLNKNKFIGSVIDDINLSKKSINTAIDNYIKIRKGEKEKKRRKKRRKRKRKRKRRTRQGGRRRIRRVQTT